MKSNTQTLISALRVLARDIETDDGVVNAVLDEAAERLHSLSLKLPVSNRKWQDLHDNDGAIIDGYGFVCNDKRGHIDSYGNVTWSGWNTAETLPESGVAVLAVVNDGISKPFVIRAMYAGKRWCVNDNYENWMVDGEVTHWMQLPAPPSR